MCNYGYPREEGREGGRDCYAMPFTSAHGLVQTLETGVQVPKWDKYQAQPQSL